MESLPFAQHASKRSQEDDLTHWNIEQWIKVGLEKGALLHWSYDEEREVYTFTDWRRRNYVPMPLERAYWYLVGLLDGFEYALKHGRLIETKKSDKAPKARPRPRGKSYEKEFVPPEVKEVAKRFSAPKFDSDTSWIDGLLD